MDRITDINNRKFMSLCRQLDALYNSGNFTPEEEDVKRYKEALQCGTDIMMAMCTLERVTKYPSFLRQAESLRDKWVLQTIEGRDEEREV